MIEDVIESSFDTLVELCHSGKRYGHKRCEPNGGKFGEEFIIKFIGIVRDGGYARELEYKIEEGCASSLLNLSLFCGQMIDQLEACKDGFEDDDLINNICASLDSIIESKFDEENSDPESKSLYSNIEDLIIRWNIDGSKTAGHLTRQIMTLIEK